MFLLDTNVCIRLLQGRSVNMLRRLESVADTDKCLCSVVAAELLYGAAKSQRKKETLERLNQFLN